MVSRRKGFRSWFVEPYKQIKLGLIFLILNIIFGAIIFGVYGYYIYDIYYAVSSYFQLNADQSSTTLSKFIYPLSIGLVIVVFFIVTTILVSVKCTHNIYGPLVSINRCLDQMIEGRTDIEPLKLRPSDELKDVAHKLNILIEKYKK